MIDKEELKELIRDYVKENLSIQASRNQDYGYGGSTSNYIEITLYFDDEEISSATIDY